MKTLTDEQRVVIVRYRMENAQKTIKEVESHRDNGFYNTAVNRMYLETVDELFPSAKLFVQSIGKLVEEWLESLK